MSLTEKLQQDKLANPPKKHSWYALFWLKERNVAFAGDCEVAVRGALLVTILALPFMLPFKINGPAEHTKGSGIGLGTVTEAVTEEFDVYHAIEHGWLQTYSISCFLFAYYKDLGTTINLAISGTFGTFLAVFGSWVLFGFFPKSITPEMVANPTAPESLLTYTFAFAYGAGFLWLCMWLNLNLNAVIFAAGSFVWYLMEFLKPNTNLFATGFEIELRGYASKQFIAAFGGSLLAVFCMMFPYSITAYQRAEDNTRKTVDVLLDCWFRLASHVCSPLPNDFVLSVIERDLNFVKESVESISADIDTSWWECFGLGKMQKKRAILRAFEARLSQSHERLLATFHIAVRTHLPEDQQKREKVLALTGALKVPMESLLRECQDLFFLGIRALDEGVDAVKGDVTQNAVEVRSAIQTLSQEFRTAKAAAQKRGRQAIDGDLLEESALCMNLCALGRKVAEAAEEWAENKPLVEQGGFLGLGCMKDIFDRQTIFDPKNIRNALRIWLQLSTCFVLGFVMHWPAKYNAAIASNAAVLLSKRPGAALERNMARMQGAVLGLASGGLIYMISESVFGVCSSGNYISLSVGLFLWLAITLFIYNNSSTNAGLGFLLAYFGNSALLRGCGHVDASGAFRNMVVGLIITVVFMLVIDHFFQTEVASQVAHGKLSDSMDAVAKSLEKAFDPTLPKVEFAGKISTALGQATAWGALADAEPRFDKIPWRHATFEAALRSGNKILCIVNGLKRALVGTSPDSTKSNAMLQCASNEKFKECTTRPKVRIDQCKQLLQILIHEEEGRPNDIEANKNAIKKEGTGKFAKYTEDAITALNNLSFQMPSKESSLEDDFACQMSYQFLALREIVGECRMIAGAVIEQG